MAVTSDKKQQKLLNDLAPILHPDEQILAISHGMVEVERMGRESGRRGTVAATNRRVVVFSKKIGGYDTQDYTYATIVSVDHKKGLTAANLTIATSGDATRITQIPTGDIEDLANTIRTQVHNAHTTPSAPSPTAGATPADQVRDLAALLADGLITDTEYEQKRREILGL